MYELGLEARLGSCAVAEGRLNHALRNRQSRRCESKQDASAHAVLLQGMWLRAARARERVWDVRRVQLQVQLSAPLAMCSCGWRCASVLATRLYLATEGRLTLRSPIADDPYGGRLMFGAPHPKHIPTAPDHPPAPLAERPQTADRVRARASPAQAMGLSRPTPHPLGPLRRLRLEIQVLELRRAEDDERRAWTPMRACRYREPPAHMIATALLLC